MQPGSGPNAHDRRFLLAALLVSVAKGDGNILEVESEALIQLLVSRLRISNAEALESLTAVVIALADYERVAPRLQKIALTLGEAEKRDVLVMLLEVAAVDGERHAAELEAINRAAQLLAMPTDSIHQAFDTYFAGL